MVYVQQQPLHHNHIGITASASAGDDMGSNSTVEDDQKAFELSQYTPLGIAHFSAGYKNDPSALEKLSRRINNRVEQDSSDLITFCDKRIRKRRKKQKDQSKSKSKQHEDERSYHDGNTLGSSSTVGPEIVKASDLLVGKCLGQGSFSSVFVLEKHIHRPPSTTAPRRGRRSKLTTGTNQGSTSRRGASMRLDMCNSTHGNKNNSMSTHSTSRHTIHTTTPETTGMRRRVRQEYNSVDDVPNENDGSHRSLDNSSSQRSRSLSPRRSPNEESNDGSRSRSLSRSFGNGIRSRSRSVNRSIRNGIRKCFGKSPLHQDYAHSFDNEEDEENYYRQKVKRNSDESIFRGGSRSLSCRKRRSKIRRSRSSDGLANTSRTSFNTDLDNNSTHSCDAALSQAPRRGVLWKKNFPDEEIDDSCGGANSNLVVKILQPKLMDQPKLFANCAAGLIREGLFLAAIDHPHVLKVHAWTNPKAWMDFTALATKEGDLYDGYILVLERLKGGSLKGWMNRWQLQHKEEQRALAAVEAMEIEERLKGEQSKRRRLRKRRSLSLSSSSDESASFSPSTNPSLMASKYRRSLDSEFTAAAAAATATAAAAALEEEAPVSPGHSPKAAFDAVYQNQYNNRSYPYTTRWPKTQLSDRASILLQLSDTVKYLHKHRILHRDLKPDNLGVTFIDNPKDGSKQKQYASTLSLKIFDFDISRLVPEEPEVVDLPVKKKKSKRNSSGSVKSFDPEMLNNNQSNRSGRSVSPFRTSSSLTGDKQVRRKVKGKYRGKRPGSKADATETDTKTEPAVPTEVAIDTESTMESNRRDALFEMTAKMGSPRYMAPEIARGEPYNLRSEVYTVCLLVHEVLTLQKPYDELQPEDHSRLVHFDLPGYRPPIFSDWKWPSELEEILHMGWGDISQRPSMKEVNSVLKRALPKLCPKVGKQLPKHSLSTAPDESSQKAPEEQPKKSKKGRGLFLRTPKKYSKHNRKSIRSSSLTPTASNSDLSTSDDDHLKTVE